MLLYIELSLNSTYYKQYFLRIKRRTKFKRYTLKKELFAVFDLSLKSDIDIVIEPQNPIFGMDALNN